MLKQTAKLLTLLFALFFSIRGMAQIDYQLKDFQTPDVDFRILSVGTNLGGGFNSHDSRNDGNGYGALNFDYYSYKNTISYVGTQRVNLRGTADFRSSEATNNAGNSFDDNRNSQNYVLYLSSENRFYKDERSGSFFGLHVGSYQDLGFSNSTFEDITVEERKSQSIYSSGQLFLTYGKGRIEPVRYARLAYDTYDWLNKKNRLTETPSDEQIDEVGAVMTTVANTRIFDSRFKRIFELEQIDSALQAQGLISEADMVYFAQVADIWGYANSFERGSGDLWEIGVVGDLDYDNDQSSTWMDDTLSSEFNTTNNAHTAVYGYFSYLNQKPLSVKWQRDYNAAFFAGAGQYFEEIDNAEDANMTPEFRGTLQAGYALGYYPNTRTSWKTGVTFLGSYGDDIYEDEKSNFGIAIEGSSRLYYWFSPRFRLSASVSIRYNDGFTSQGFDSMIDSSIYFARYRQSYDSWNTRFTTGLSYAFL